MPLPPGDADEDRLSETGIFMYGHEAVIRRLRAMNEMMLDMIRTLDSDRPPPPDTPYTPPYGLQAVQRESQH